MENSDAIDTGGDACCYNRRGSASGTVSGRSIWEIPVVTRRSMMWKTLVLIGTTWLAAFGIARTASAELIGYWSFEEGAGEIAKDGSGNGSYLVFT